jgi:hypothetical protein
LETERATEIATLVSACDRPVTSPGRHGDALASLIRLAELRDRAVVTEGEYQAKKRELLERMLAD